MARVVHTIRNQVYEIIKKDICDGIYQPGQWLQEVELANKLNVSRSPVREALRQLASDGLLVEVPNKGIFVREFTPKDMEEIYDMRVMLEDYAFQCLEGRLTADGIDQLNECLSLLEYTFKNKNLKKYIELDAKLHELFVKLSDNNLLQMVYERVHLMIHQFRMSSLSDEQRFMESMEEHRTIVQEIINGNTKKAQQINHRHLELAKARVLKLIEENRAK